MVGQGKRRFDEETYLQNPASKGLYGDTPWMLFYASTEFKFCMKKDSLNLEKDNLHGIAEKEKRSIMSLPISLVYLVSNMAEILCETTYLHHSN